MKLRTGFVSNSSSTSFVIAADTSAEAADILSFAIISDLSGVEFVDGDGQNWGRKHIERTSSSLEALRSDYNGVILIPYTTNFETWIYPAVDGGCYVETCNNIDWSSIEHLILADDPVSDDPRVVKSVEVFAELKYGYAMIFDFSVGELTPYTPRDHGMGDFEYQYNRDMQISAIAESMVPDTIFCPKCNVELKDGVIKKCPFCGWNS